MIELAIVTGPFRSGTSMLAEVCHRLGFCAATSMAPPIPPSWRADWEDFELSVALAAGARPGRADLRSYVERRAQVSQSLGFGGRLTIKSPYLALVWSDLMTATFDMQRTVVRCRRDEDARQASVRAYPQLSKRDDRAICAALDDVNPDIDVAYEGAVAHPEQAVTALAVSLGVVDDGAVRAAWRGIGRPTEYTCLLQPHP